MTIAYQNATGPFNFFSAEALAIYRFVKMSSGDVVYADAGDEPIGITQIAVANDEEVSIMPMNGGIYKVVASGAISQGAAIYVANDGKVSASANGKQIGLAVLAATANNDVISAVIWSPRGGNDVFSSRSSYYRYFDDFFEYDATATVGNWAVTEDAGAGTGDALTDAAGGVLNVGCDGDDNDECYVSSIAEGFLCQTNKYMQFEARVKLAEANTDDANIIVGLSDTVGANTLVDDGAGPAASYDGLVFFKVDGGTVWQAETSNAGTQVTDTNAGAFTDDTWTRLTIFYDYNDGVTANVYFYVDGVLGATNTLTIAGMAEMHVLLGVKAGDANEENLLVDYVDVVCER